MKIDRRTFIAGAGAAAALAGLGGYALLKRARPARPNIIVFIADDMRADAAGFMGNEIIRTPHLDALAKESFVFDKSFVATSTCWSSRASLLTGMHLARHRVYRSTDWLGPKLFGRSYPQLLRKAGYHTGFVGKWHIGRKTPDKAFDYWRGFLDRRDYRTGKDGRGEHLTDLQTRQALEFLESAPGGKPFLLTLAYRAPHGPFTPQERFLPLYADAAMARHAADSPESFQRLPELLRKGRGRHEYVVHRYESDEGYQNSVKNYYRLITGLDESVGKVTAWLEERDMLENTLVVFASDNGLMLGSHGLAGKWCMFEDSIRTPLLMRLPGNFYSGHRAGRVSAVALNIDLAPTLLDAAGVEKPPMHGKSLLPVMTGGPAPRDGFFYEHGWIGSPRPLMGIAGCVGWRGREWKYARYFAGKKSEEMLFNLAKDPRELANLAEHPAHAAVLKKMRQRVKQAMKTLR